MIHRWTAHLAEFDDQCPLPKTLDTHTPLTVFNDIKIGEAEQLFLCLGQAITQGWLVGSMLREADKELWGRLRHGGASFCRPVLSLNRQYIVRLNIEPDMSAETKPNHITLAPPARWWSRWRR